VKVQTAEVLHDVVRALHVHGALGCSNEMPLVHMWMTVPVMGIADGPTEVHKVTVAKQVLKQYRPYEGSGRATSCRSGRRAKAKVRGADRARGGEPLRANVSPQRPAVYVPAPLRRARPD
jgi:hypothetical protein